MDVLEFLGAEVAGSAGVPRNGPGGVIWSINGAGGFDRRAPAIKAYEQQQSGGLCLRGLSGDFGLGVVRGGAAAGDPPPPLRWVEFWPGWLRRECAVARRGLVTCGLRH